MQVARRFGMGAVVGAALLAFGSPGIGEARTFVLSPAVSGSDEEFENVANTLQPGDSLLLHGGVYSQTGRRAITCTGTATAPVVIACFPGEAPVLTRPADEIDTRNNIELVGCRYLVLHGLHFQGGNSGLRVVGGDHVTIEGCEIHDTGNNALAINADGSTYDAFVIRGNEIHHTGRSTSGPTEGEGMYLGCNDDACRMVNSLIEGNHVHDTRATSEGGNDGIELKEGSYNNVIRYNVVHDTIDGTQFPGIFVYGGGRGVNTVEGNVVWSCGEGIQVVSDAVVRNNLVLASVSHGITAGPHPQVPRIGNVTIVDNTIYGSPTGIYVRWSGATNMVLANNAVYCPGATAVDAAGLEDRGVTVRANFVEGMVNGVPLDNEKLIPGGSAASAFEDPAANDFWPGPGSPLLGHASANYSALYDFNGTLRTSPYDVGAYETEGLARNPGWKVQAALRPLPARSSAPAAAPARAPRPAPRRHSR